MSDFHSLSKDRLEQMAEAGGLVVECIRVLSKTKDNVVGELLKGSEEFYQWDHYPKGDVYDPQTHSQFYYHAHPADLRIGEHGHFHTFLRPKGMPEGISPLASAEAMPPEKAPEKGGKKANKKKKGQKDENAALSHLVGISMDSRGFPIRLFTTNRWVTGETWYKAEDVIAMLDSFNVDIAQPSWPVNIWTTNMIALFRPQIETLLIERDRVVTDWAQSHQGENPYEDRDLEVPSLIDISIEQQVRALDEVFNARE